MRALERVLKTFHDGLTREQLRRLHLDCVSLQRDFPGFLGRRLMTNCPIDHTSEPRSALAAYMRANTQPEGT